MRGQKHRHTALRLFSEQVLQKTNAARIEPHGWFIDNQDLGLMQKSGRKDGALFHAVRIAFRQVVDEFAQTEKVYHLSNPLPGVIRRQVVHVGYELEEFA